MGKLIERCAGIDIGKRFFRVEEIPSGGRFSLAVSAVSSFVPV